MTVRGGLRTPLRPLKDPAWSHFVLHLRPEFPARARGTDFNSMLGSPDLENYCFYLGKLMIFTKSTFADRHTLFARFSCLWVLRGCFWNPLGAVVGALGRSWEIMGRSCAARETFLEPLGDALGTHVGAPGGMVRAKNNCEGLAVVFGVHCGSFWGPHCVLLGFSRISRNSTIEKHRKTKKNSF